MEDTLNDDILVELLQCKAQIEQVKKAKEECHQEMQTCTLEMDTINDIISENASSAKVAPEGSQLDHIMKIMIRQGVLNDNEAIIKDMSDDAVKKLRDDLTSKAMLYLEQERAQKNKAEKENLEALDTDLCDIEQELQGYMVTSVPRAKADEKDIDNLTAEVINLRMRVQKYSDTQTRNAYQGEWDIRTYEPYQMEALNIVRYIVEELVKNVLEKVGATSPFKHMQYLEKLLIQSSKEQLVEESSLLLIHQTIMNIGVKWLNEVITEMCLEIAQHAHKAATLANDIVDMIIISQLPVKKDERDVDSSKNEMLKTIFHQMKIDRQQRSSCWRHTQLLSRWAKDGATKETLDHKKNSNITEITLPQNVLLQSVAGSSESDDGEEENILMGLSIKLQESKSFKNISAASFSPNRRYVAIGVTADIVDKHGWGAEPDQELLSKMTKAETDPFLLASTKITNCLKDIQPVTAQLLMYIRQLLVYDNSKVSLICEVVISKEKLDFLHLAWSLDSTYLLTVTTKGTLECWQIFTGKITSAGLSIPKLIVQIVKDDCKLKGDLKLSANAISLPYVMVAEFYPTFSILGIQPWLVIGLSSGDIIKCHIMPDIQLMTPQVEPVLQFGNNYSAELFRGHEPPILSIVFSHFTGEMISLDVTYNLFMWDYSKDGFSGYGWYTPQKCFKLNFELTMYTPLPDVSVKTRYDDRLEKSQRRKTNAEKQQIYRKALAELQSIEKSYFLWQELTNDNGSQKQFYVPQETQHSSFPCHIAVKDKDRQLLSYVISTYQTIKVSPVKLLTCYQGFTGKELTFHLLYKHELIPPQGVRVSLDLITVKLNKSISVDKNIKDNSSNLPYLLHKYINQ